MFLDNYAYCNICDIHTIDFQVCYMGKKLKNNKYFATEFLESNHVKEVYATSGWQCYSNEFNNCLATGGYYRYRLDSKKQIIRDGGTFFILLCGE